MYSIRPEMVTLAALLSLLTPSTGLALDCPTPSIGICVEACNADSQCGTGEKCCFNGCGHTCEDVVPLECPTSPAGTCTTGFEKGLLVVNERKAGKEQLIAKLLRGPAFTQEALGDPTVPVGTSYALCLYDDADALVAGVDINTPGVDCGTKPCWKSLRDAPPAGVGFRYKDKDAAESGVKTAVLKSGKAGRTSIVVVAGNNPKKGQSALPAGTTTQLAATSNVRVQLIGDHGECFETNLSDIKKQEADFFKAK